MRFFVVGSARHLEEARRDGFEQACLDLGRALALGKHTVLVCSESQNTADPHIVAGANTSGTEREAEIIMYHPAGTPPLHDPNRYKHIHFTKRPSEGGWQVAHLAAINDAEVVIAIGGSDGTLTSIYCAELLNKPVVLVSCYEGATRRALGYFAHLYREDERTALNQEWSLPGNG